MGLTTEQYSSALGLVDEIIQCNAQLHFTTDGRQRAALVSSMAARQTKLLEYLDTAEAP